MRIAGLERRLMPIGKIRLGDQIASKGGKKRPHVLEKVRMTSSNAFLLQEASKLYGGKPRPWEDAPPGPNQWELYVEVDAIPIIIPPIEALHQCYETWSAKGCLRRCDSQTIRYALDAQEVGQPCCCPSDPEERQAAAADGQACKLTTRISCMLPDLPGIGLWVIETHSYYASLWTAGMVELLESMAKQGRMCEALLKIERQSRKTRHGVRNFAIPVILPQQMTPRQLFAQEMHQALHPGTPLIALPDERQKSLPEHISDLYGDPLPDPLRPDIFDLTAQLEAVVASHHGDLEALYTWAERRFGKPRVQLTTDDLTTLLTLVRNRAKIKTIIEDTPLTESMDPETGELHGDEEPHDDKAQDEATF